MLFHMCSLHRVQGTFNIVKNCAQALEAFVESKCVLPEYQRCPVQTMPFFYLCKGEQSSQMGMRCLSLRAFFGGGQFPSLQALFIRETTQ